jgi:hypothetical protein
VAERDRDTQRECVCLCVFCLMLLLMMMMMMMTILLTRLAGYSLYISDTQSVCVWSGGRTMQLATERATQRLPDIALHRSALIDIWRKAEVAVIISR